MEMMKIHLGKKSTTLYNSIHIKVKNEVVPVLN
jgi:hypothetical protein